MLPASHLGQDGDVSIPVLVAMTGLPATGKSAIAEAVARRLRSPVFSVDPLEATLHRNGITREQRSDYAAYDLVAMLAESQLRLGQSAVIDAVNAKGFLRRWWVDIAGRHDAHLVTLATICSDQRLHRQRLEQRRRDIEGYLDELTWSDVERGMGDYDPALDVDLVLDAVRPLEDNIDEVLNHLAAAGIV
jgi:predicted kinase